MKVKALFISIELLIYYDCEPNSHFMYFCNVLGQERLLDSNYYNIDELTNISNLISCVPYNQFLKIKEMLS